MGQSAEELTTQIEDTRERMAGPGHAAGPGEPLGDRGAAQAGCWDRVSSVKDKVMGSAHSAKDSVSSAASSATSGVSGTGSSVASTAQDQLQGAPWRRGSWPSGPASCSPPCCLRAAWKRRPRTA